jgi:AcrR family transcriptional regulator
MSKVLYPETALRKPQSPPTAPTRRPRVAEECILDAAASVFARDGFDGATMDAIAACAATTKPTLYARFGSKNALFAAAVAREYEIRKSRLFAAYGSGENIPFSRRLHTWVTAYFDLARERPEGFALIAEGERYAAYAPAVESGASEIVDRIAALVARVSDRDNQRGARAVAAMISGLLRACASDALRDDINDLDRAAALCESFLYSALRGLDADLIDAMDGTTPVVAVGGETGV